MDASTAIRRARQLMENGNIDEALIEYSIAEQFAETDEQKFEAMLHGGLLILAKGDKQGAEMRFRKVIQSFPWRENGYINLYMVYAIQGRETEAEAALREGIEKVGPNGNLRITLSLFHWESRRRKLALDTLETLLEEGRTEVQDVLLLKHLIQLYLQTALETQDPTQAQEAIDREKRIFYHLAHVGTRLMPDNFLMWYRYGDIAEGIGELEEAIRANRTIVEWNQERIPDRVDYLTAHVGLARCLVQCDQYDEALEVLERVAKTPISIFDNYNCIAGIAQYQKGQRMKARQHFSMVVNSHFPGTSPVEELIRLKYRAEAYRYLALISSEEGDYRQMFSYTECMLATNPNTTPEQQQLFAMVKTAAETNGYKNPIAVVLPREVIEQFQLGEKSWADVLLGASSIFPLSTKGNQVQ